MVSHYQTSRQNKMLSFYISANHGNHGNINDESTRAGAQRRSDRKMKIKHKET